MQSNDAADSRQPQQPRKKKPYTRPTATVVPVEVKAQLLTGSQPVRHKAHYFFGETTDDPTYDNGPIIRYDDKPTKISKFKNGYWVDDDDDW